EHSARERILEFAQCRSHRRHVIFRQRARICPRISDSFVSFVERLRDLQGAFGGATEAAVCFALQAREIVQLRCDLRARFFLLHPNAPLLTSALALNGLGNFAMPQSRRSAVLIPKRTVCSIKPLLRIRQIQGKPSEQPSCSLDFALIFVERFVEPSPWI